MSRTCIWFWLKPTGFSFLVGLWVKGKKTKRCTDMDPLLDDAVTSLPEARGLRHLWTRVRQGGWNPVKVEGPRDGEHREREG